MVLKEKLAFDILRDRINSAPILALLDNSRPYCIEADSSDFTTRAVLSQENPDDSKWHPIAFLSKFLSLVERNYKIHDKEMLAVFQALEEWRHFLEGTKHQFEIWMDHKNLEYFMMAKKLNWRQAQWSLLLARFDFLLHHWPRKTMGKPDVLRQRSDHRSGMDDNQNLTLVRGHPPNPVSIMKPDNHVSAPAPTSILALTSIPAPTSIPTPYIPPHRRVHFKIPL